MNQHVVHERYCKKSKVKAKDSMVQDGTGVRVVYAFVCVCVWGGEGEGEEGCKEGEGEGGKGEEGCEEGCEEGEGEGEGRGRGGGSLTTWVVIPPPIACTPFKKTFFDFKSRWSMCCE